MNRILIVDDESSLRLGLKRILESKGYETFCVANTKEALNLSPNISFQAAIVDLNLPDGKGTDLIQQLKTKYPYIQSILITGERSEELKNTITHAVNKGVFLFLPKPLQTDMLIKMTEEAVSVSKTQEQNNNLKNNIKKQFHFNKIIGQSEAVLEMTELMHKVAKSNSNILITGESGTGKELVARSIHCARDSSLPFISVNCGAIPKELLESEFFGHKKGSFTGAVTNHKGRFAEAGHGTLFLDEIGSMDFNLQVKLLRVLQEKEFSPVGSSEVIPSHAHIIAATNINLEDAVKRKEFREDLFYRLNIIPINIEPLRKRATDIPLLISHFIEIFGSKNKTIDGINPDALSALCKYEWPGNIRELENLIERLSVLKTGGPITIADLPKKYALNQERLATIELPTEGLDFNKAVDAYENELIMQALTKTKWNRKQAANLLKLNRTTLVEKIKKKGLQNPFEELEEKELLSFKKAS